MRSLRFLALLFLSAFLASRSPAKPNVVAAQPLLADFAHVIAQDDVELTCLLTANADPHSYEPSPADLRRLVQADLVIVNGLGLEPWIDQLVHNSGFRGRLAVASQGCPLQLHLQNYTNQNDDEGAAASREWDPHAWHDLANARDYVIVIRDALKQVEPAAAARFDKRAKAYTELLDELERYTRAQLATIPANQRRLVTSHDSLQYLAHEYGLKIIPIAGSRPDQEPSARELGQVISLIKNQHVRAVFFEPTSSPALAQVVAQEAEVKVVRELCTDGLGAPDSVNGTFLGMFRHNIDTITWALR
ncbi:MAG TPA: zinc ABC transporter substrate-binding protein [Opitutaceae bacterium]